MDDVKTLREFGIHCNEQEAYPAAIIALEAYLEINATDYFAWLTLGDAYKVLSRFNDARTALDHALNYAPENLRWCAMTVCARLETKSGHHADAEIWYERAFAEPDFSTSRWPHTLRGSNLIRLERFVEAEQHLRRATELEDKYDEDDLDEAWHMLGVALLGQERLEEAAAAFKQALVVNPEFEMSRKQLDGLKQAEVARRMIADLPSPGIDRLV